MLIPGEFWGITKYKYGKAHGNLVFVRFEGGYNGVKNILKWNKNR